MKTAFLPAHPRGSAIIPAEIRLHLPHKKDIFIYHFPGQSMKSFVRHHCELLTWGLALLYLMIIDPSHQAAFRLCPLHLLGFSWCPGCGLGRSLSYLLHGSIADSISAHWLGIPASMIILYRCITLLMNDIRGSARIAHTTR